MNVNLELYKTFYVVAKYKHMTKASEELHVSQPAISQAIKKLEEELGMEKGRFLKKLILLIRSMDISFNFQSR